MQDDSRSENSARDLKSTFGEGWMHLPLRGRAETVAPYEVELKSITHRGIRQ
jgi:hypothetical protein